MYPLEDEEDARPGRQLVTASTGQHIYAPRRGGKGGQHTKKNSVHVVVPLFI